MTPPRNRTRTRPPRNRTNRQHGDPQEPTPSRPRGAALDPEIKINTPQPTPPAGKSFADLGIEPALVKILADQGIQSPRPIQTTTVTAAMDGKDVCGRAPTGSGKTLAFALPLAHLNRSRGKPVGMVLAPTRELAIQITEVLEPLAAHQGLRIRTLIGGTKINQDITALRKGVDIVVGCPGRMIDLANRNALVLRHVRMAVLDEADRMADMGFLPDVTRLLDQTDCNDGQLLLFSATLDETTDKLERRYQDSPTRADVDTAPKAKGNVTHTWHVLNRMDRRDVAVKVLKDHESAIVFSRTKRGADRLARQLTQRGLQAVPIHGDRSQGQRQRALAQFADGDVGILVATDIAARGIHVDEVDLVLHFDMPGSSEDYTHRSGRTGRAGHDGTVVALVCDDLTNDAKDVAKHIEVTPTIIGNINVQKASPPKQPNNRPGGGNRGRNQGQQPRGNKSPGGGNRKGRGAGGRPQNAGRS